MSPATVRRILALGLPPEKLADLLEIIADEETAQAEATAAADVKKSNRSARNRRYYERSKASESASDKTTETSEIRRLKPSEKRPKRLKSSDSVVLNRLNQQSEAPAAQPPPSLPPPSSPEPPPSPPPPTPPPTREEAPAGFALENTATRHSRPVRTGSNGRQVRIAEAARTTAIVSLPPELNTKAFLAEWVDFCSHRERMAADNATRPWTERSAGAVIRDCLSYGAEWSAVALRTAVARGYVGPVFDPRQNPKDIRSQVMKPFNDPKKSETHGMPSSKPVKPMAMPPPEERPTSEDFAEFRRLAGGKDYAADALFTAMKPNKNSPKPAPEDPPTPPQP